MTVQLPFTKTTPNIPQKSAANQLNNTSETTKRSSHPEAQE